MLIWGGGQIPGSGDRLAASQRGRFREDARAVPDKSSPVRYVGVSDTRPARAQGRSGGLPAGSRSLGRRTREARPPQAPGAMAPARPAAQRAVTPGGAPASAGRGLFLAGTGRTWGREGGKEVEAIGATDRGAALGTGRVAWRQADCILRHAERRGSLTTAACSAREVLWNPGRRSRSRSKQPGEGGRLGLWR